MLAHTSVYRTSAPSAAQPGDLPGPLHHLRDRLVARGGGDTDMHPGLGPAQEERVGHVVAVPQVGEHDPREIAPPFPDREEICQTLTRVLEIGQHVDDGNLGRPRQRLQPFLLERADRDRVRVAGENPSGVLDGLAPAELQLL